MTFRDIVFSPITLVVLCVLAIWPLKKLVAILEIRGLRHTLHNHLCPACRRILGTEFVVRRFKSFSQEGDTRQLPAWEIECPRCHAKSLCSQDGKFYSRAVK